MEDTPNVSESATSPLTHHLPIEVVHFVYAEEVRFTASLQSVALAQAFADVPREHYLGAGPWQVVKSGSIHRHTMRTPDIFITACW